MKTIELTKGFFAFVDDEDYERINKYKWYADKSTQTYYARRRVSKYGKMEHMHRVVMNLEDNKTLFVDHIDHNGLNNQKYNLRVATRSQNNANKNAVGKSKFLGVFYQCASTKRPWYARVKMPNYYKYLGSFKTEMEAAIAYNNAAIEVHGEFANLNKIETETNIQPGRDNGNVQRY